VERLFLWGDGRLPVSVLGVPGMIVLQFKATTAGETSLHLDYKRTW
jgi:predicted secreted protein